MEQSRILDFDLMVKCISGTKQKAKIKSAHDVLNDNTLLHEDEGIVRFSKY